MAESLCFICSQPATETTQVPAAGWGAAHAKAYSFSVPACAAHAPAPAGEAELVTELVAAGSRKAARPAPERVREMKAWLQRLALAMFGQVFDQPWGRNVVLVVPRLGVEDEARDLADELQYELKEPIFELFPEPGPHAKLDYHFFESDSDLVEDNVLWVRLPGGLVAYAWPGEL